MATRTLLLRRVAAELDTDLDHLDPKDVMRYDREVYDACYTYDGGMADAAYLELRADNERLQRRCEIYAAGIIAIATYEGEYGLGYEVPKRIANQTRSRIEVDT